MSQVLLNNVLMNNNEKIKEIIVILLKLFRRRRYFNTNNDDKVTQMVTDIKMNGKTNLTVDKVKISIYYKDIDLKNISSGSEVDEFLSKNTDFIKFVILKEFSKKVYPSSE